MLKIWVPPETNQENVWRKPQPDRRAGRWEMVSHVVKMAKNPKKTRDDTFPTSYLTTAADTAQGKSGEDDSGGSGESVGAGNATSAVELESGRATIGENMNSDQDSLLLDLQEYMMESRKQGNAKIV